MIHIKNTPLFNNWPQAEGTFRIKIYIDITFVKINLITIMIIFSK